MKQYQEDLLRQIEEKDRNKKKEFKEEMYERRAKLIAELDYRRKIDQQKYQAKSEVIEMLISAGCTTSPTSFLKL